MPIRDFTGSTLIASHGPKLLGGMDYANGSLKLPILRIEAKQKKTGVG